MNPFVRKLRHGARLSEDEEAVLASLAEPAQRTERGDILSEGRESRAVGLILDGWACRYKQLENGKRQITSVFLPGDLCEPFGALPPVMDYSFGALTPVLIARVPLNAVRNAARVSPRIDEALWWDLLLSDAIAREHMVSLGRRSATERLGHFFCEVHVRLKMTGRADQSFYEMPLTQADLADLFGLSTVHVNRSLQELRGSGLISIRGRRVTIHYVDALRQLSMFDPAYLRPSGTDRV